MSAASMRATARAVPRHLRRAADRLGLPGVVGVALLAASAAYYAGTVRPLQQELRAKPAVVLPVQRAVPRGPADAAGERLASYAASFPSEAETTRVLARVYQLGERAGVRLAHGEYRYTEADALGLAQYHLVLPTTGTYPQVRQFIASVLEALPSAAVTQVALQRERVGAGLVEARVEMTLHMRAATARVAGDAPPQRLSAAPESAPSPSERGTP